MIPTAALPESIDVYACNGITGYGTLDIAAVPVTMPCAVAPYTGQVTLQDGSVAKADFKATIRPGTTVPLWSTAVWRGASYTVVALALAVSPRGDEAIELTLVGAG